MPDIDTEARQKWPAPHPYPNPAELGAEVERAKEEAATDPIRAKARAVLALLRAEYGEPDWPFLEPLNSLVEILLSHRTTDPQAWAAFEELKRRFPTWDDARDAPVAEITEAIHGTTWPEQKAPRIKAVLQKISQERGDLDLSFLNDLSLEEADAWLQSLGGVGPKSAACVLLFACHKPILPVDTHLHRVSIRLGLIGPDVDANAAHPMLQSLLPDPTNARDVLAFHRNMLLHGQRICVWRDPKCPDCVIRDWCDYYATHPEKQAQTARKQKAQAHKKAT
jgi:endonuclease III